MCHREAAIYISLMGAVPDHWRTLAGWFIFFASVLVCWIALFIMAIDATARLPGALLGPGMSLLGPISPDFAEVRDMPFLLGTICFGGVSAGDLSFGSLMIMWMLMSIAMMAPSGVPVFKTYWDISLGASSKISALGFYALVIGFLSVWGVFSVFAAAAQYVLSLNGGISIGGILRSDMISAILLLLAGIYQFTPLKEACLNRCRSPMMFFFAHWRDGLRGAYMMGVRQGAYCVGCCGALMLLAFVGGTMNLVWMGIGMVLMALEKLPSFGKYLTRPAGMVLVSSAVWVGIASIEVPQWITY